MLYTTGDPDPTFGVGGIVTPAVTPLAMAMWGDKIVLAGGDSENLWLERLNADGSPDASFGKSGIVQTSVQLSAIAAPSETTAMTIDPADGRIAVGGRGFVYVFRADGSKDP